MPAFIHHAFTVLIESRARCLPAADALLSRFTVLIERTLAGPVGIAAPVRRLN